VFVIGNQLVRKKGRGQNLLSTTYLKIMPSVLCGVISCKLCNKRLFFTLVALR
jgi:hypothetical protein